jgi:hypothetical protein
MRHIKTSMTPLKKRKSSALPFKLVKLRFSLLEEARITTYSEESGNPTSPTGLREISKT